VSYFTVHWIGATKIVAKYLCLKKLKEVLTPFKEALDNFTLK
jgi:hypothetical protein